MDKQSISIFQGLLLGTFTFCLAVLYINGGKDLPASFFLLGRDGLRRGGGVSSICSSSSESKSDKVLM